MQCDCLNCECNTNSYCDISSHIAINENEQCDEMLIHGNTAHESRNKNTT